jgi:hypothetical protein
MQFSFLRSKQEMAQFMGACLNINIISKDLHTGVIHPVFKFDILYFIPVLVLSDNTNSSRSNVENDVGRYEIYPDRFHP